MILNTEEMQKQKNNITECEDFDKCKMFGNGSLICSNARRCRLTMNLIDTIESQQQEIEQLKGDRDKAEEYAMYWAGECLEKDKALEQAREVLKDISYQEIEDDAGNIYIGCECCLDDLETMRVYGHDDCKIGRALSAIDKALGGNGNE